MTIPSKIFRTTRRVEFCDTDMAGIVHFSNFFRYMEAAEVELLRTLGQSVKMEWQGHSIGFPRVSATCDYVRPARFEDVLDIAVTLERIGLKAITYGFNFTRQDELLARGKVTSVCCQVKEHKKLESIEIPGPFRQKLTDYFGDADDRPS